MGFDKPFPPSQRSQCGLSYEANWKNVPSSVLGASAMRLPWLPLPSATAATVTQEVTQRDRGSPLECGTLPAFQHLHSLPHLWCLDDWCIRLLHICQEGSIQARKHQMFLLTSSPDSSCPHNGLWPMQLHQLAHRWWIVELSDGVMQIVKGSFGFLNYNQQMRLQTCRDFYLLLRKENVVIIMQDSRK